jgi:Starch/carbohydrate-binding module (family 53)
MRERFPLRGLEVSLHHGLGGWRQTTDIAMSVADDGKQDLTLKLPVDACQFDFVSTDGTRWDNHGGRDWQCPHPERAGAMMPGWPRLDVLSGCTIR